MEAAKKQGERIHIMVWKMDLIHFLEIDRIFQYARSQSEIGNEKKEKGEEWMWMREKKREWLLNIEANRFSCISCIIQHTHTPLIHKLT